MSDAKKLKELLIAARDCIKKNEFTEALNHCKNAIKLDKNNYNIYLFVGVCYTNLIPPPPPGETIKPATSTGDEGPTNYARSEQAFKKAIELQPDNPQALQGLCELYAKVNDKAKLADAYTELISLYRKLDATANKDKIIENLKKLAALKQELNQFDESIKVYQELADLSLSCNDTTGAVAAYQCMLNVLKVKEEQYIARETDVRLQKKAKAAAATITIVSEASKKAERAAEEALVSDELLMKDYQFDEVYTRILELGYPPLDIFIEYIKRIYRRLCYQHEFVLEKNTDQSKRKTLEDQRNKFRAQLVTECLRALKFHPLAPYPLQILLLLQEEDEGISQIGNTDEKLISRLINNAIHGAPFESISLIQLGSLLYYRTLPSKYQYHASEPSAYTAQLESLLVILEKGTTLCHNSVLGWLILGLVYFDMKRFRKALECVNKGMKQIELRKLKQGSNLESLRIRLSLLLARALLQIHQRDKSEAAFKEVLAAQQKQQQAKPIDQLQNAIIQLEVVMGIGQISLENKSYERAVECMQKVLQLNGQLAADIEDDVGLFKYSRHFAHSKLGLIYLTYLPQYDQAELHLLNALELQPENALDHNMIGRLYWEMGGDRRTNKDFAYKHLLQSAKLDPQLPSNFTYLGHYFRNEAAARSEDDPEREDLIARAKKCYQKAVSLDSLETAAGENLSELYLSDGQVTLAVNLYQDATSRNVRAKWAWKRLGFYQLSLNSLEDALRSFQHAIRVDPLDGECWEGLATTYEKQGKYTASLRAFAKAIDLNPDSVFALYRTGYINHLLGNLSEAKELFEKIVNIRKQDEFTVCGYKGLAEVDFQIAKAKYQDGLYEGCAEYLVQALNALDETLKLQTTQQLATVWKLLADIHSFFYFLPDNISVNGSERINIAHHLEQATKAYTKVTELNPDNSFPLYDLGVSYYYRAVFLNKSAKDGAMAKPFFDQAVAAFKRAITINPNHCKFWNALGCALQGDYALQQHAFIKAIEKDPKNHRPWENLGFTYLAQQEYGLAKKAFLKAQNLYPSSHLAWIGLALINENAPQFEGLELARAAFEHSALLEQTPAASLGLGYTAFILGKHHQAASALRKYIQYNGQKDPCPWNVLGLSLEAQGQFERACDAFQKSIALLQQEIELGNRNDNQKYNKTVNGKLSSTATVVFPEDGKPDPSILLLLTRFNLARSLCAMGNYDQSFQLFNQCATDPSQLFKTDAQFLRWFAFVCFGLQKYDQCIKLLQAAQKFNNDTPGDAIDIFIALSHAYLHMKDVNKSEEAIKQCLQQYSRSKKALLAFSSLYMMTSRVDKALQLLKDCYESTNRTDLDVYMFEYYAYLVKGDLKEARSTICRAINLFPDNQALWDDFAHVMLLQNAGNVVPAQRQQQHQQEQQQPGSIPIIHPLKTLSSSHLARLCSQLVPTSLSKYLANCSHNQEQLVRRLYDLSSLYYSMGVSAIPSPQHQHSPLQTVQKALSCVQQALAFNPQSIDAWRLLACCAHTRAHMTGQQRDLEASVQTFLNYFQYAALQQKPADIYTHVALCEDYIALKDYDACLRHVKDLMTGSQNKHLQSAYSNSMLFCVLARCLKARGEPAEKWMKMIEKSLQNNPNSIYTWQFLADSYTQAGQLSCADTCLTTIADILEKDVVVRPQLLYANNIRRGLVYLRIKDPKRANPLLKKAAKFNSESPVANFMLGQLAMVQSAQQPQQLDDALNYFREAIRLSPSLPLAHFSEYLVHYKLEQWQEAENELWYEKEISPVHAFVYHHLAVFALESSAPQAALGLIQKAIHLDPTNSEYWDTLVTIQNAALDSGQ